MHAPQTQLPPEAFACTKLLQAQLAQCTIHITLAEAEQATTSPLDVHMAKLYLPWGGGGGLHQCSYINTKASTHSDSKL